MNGSSSVPAAAGASSDSHSEHNGHRDLKVSTRFQDLGEPIQRLLLLNRDSVSDTEMQALTNVTVRQMAKVFDMMALEQDPVVILEWLRRAVASNALEADAAAGRHARQLCMEREQRSIELAEEMERTVVDREIARGASLDARRMQHDAAAAAAEAAAEEEEEAKMRATDELATGEDATGSDAGSHTPRRRRKSSTKWNKRVWLFFR